MPKRTPPSTPPTVIVSEQIECAPEELERCPGVPDETHTVAADTWASRADLRERLKVCALKHAGLKRCIEQHNSAGKRQGQRR